MPIRVHHSHFVSPACAVEEIEAMGLHLVEMDVPAVSNQSHWHRFSTRIYILQGQLQITDSGLGQSFTAGPGDLVEVPERVLHAEHSPLGYSIIAGMSVAPASLEEPVDLDPDLL